MSETRWSSGPWAARPDETFSTLGDKRIVAANLVSPAIVFGGLGAETEANAHLIAAAPDLYAALALVERHFQRNQASGNFQDDDEHEAWNAVSAALKKARGEA
jgi:hypothetical protein